MSDDDDDEDADPKIWIRDFFFSAPLYTEYELPEKAGYRMLVDSLIVDGHCPDCGCQATFHRAKVSINPQALHHILENYDILQLDLICMRNIKHKITFILRFIEHKAQKIGQYPSLADIANDESKTYKSVLEKQDSREFHKAIGLAAHGVGIGSLCIFGEFLSA